MTREEQIKNFMNKLKISYEEAKQLLEDDEEDYIGEEGEQMTEKAKSIKNYTQAQVEKTPRKTKERKVDEEKAEILDFLKKGLTLKINSDTIKVENEAKLHFNYNGTDYTVNLVKHRPPKK